MSENSILYLLQKSVEFLEKKEIPQARLDAELILADILKMQRIKLYAQFDQELSEKQKQEYRQKIIERSKRKPTAYITNQKNFFNSTFFVDKNVLIPRPETEELVEAVLKNENLKSKADLKILDMCCGSGCIGISLKQELKEAKVTFSDISPKAIEIAKQNAKKLLPDSQKDLHFVQGNLYENIHQESFDIIICNPPYILESEKEQLESDVIDYEPHIALFIKEPKVFFDKLLNQSFEHLNEKGILYLELNPNYIKRVLDFSQKYQKNNILSDYSKKERFLQLEK